MEIKVVVLWLARRSDHGVSGGEGCIGVDEKLAREVTLLDAQTQISESPRHGIMSIGRLRYVIPQEATFGVAHCHAQVAKMHLDTVWEKEDKVSSRAYSLECSILLSRS